MGKRSIYPRDCGGCLMKTAIGCDVFLNPRKAQEMEPFGCRAKRTTLEQIKHDEAERLRYAEAHGNESKYPIIKAA